MHTDHVEVEVVDEGVVPFFNPPLTNSLNLILMQVRTLSSSLFSVVSHTMSGIIISSSMEQPTPYYLVV